MARYFTEKFLARLITVRLSIFSILLTLLGTLKCMIKRAHKIEILIFYWAAHSIRPRFQKISVLCKF
ncbi:hypothetical protein DEJ73_13565 [Chromohalobacter salexigens]|nr:hypothetical protein [Chromohalobacter salexigens]